MSAGPAPELLGRTVVIVEGVSDQVAVLALAQRRGRDFDREGISVVPMGGAHAIGRFLREWGPQGRDRRLAGLCDAREEGDFRRALETAGLGTALSRAGMERLGFYVCEADLEDELIRALGPESAERVLEAQGDLKSFRSFQKQPAQQGRAVEAQLRRFMGTRSGRKVLYARALVAALDLDQAPRPLDRLLAHI
ncbi:MAG: ATP-dependent endonuclease [Chloroflexota bacterium]